MSSLRLLANRGGRGALCPPYLSSRPPRRQSMVSPVAQLTTRLAYGATQLSRVAWYVGHGEIMRRLSQRVRQREGETARPKPLTDRPVPERRRLFADMAKLFQQDLANVEAGTYPLPADHDGSLFKLLRRSRLFFRGPAG